jgi:hypothetical protein
MRGILKLDAIRNSYRLAVTVKGQSMTLTHDRPEARPFHSSQAVADPQGHALKHLRWTAMRPAVLRPVGGLARSVWGPVLAS